MSLADELLATVSTYPVDDSTEEHIVINQNRFITVPSSLKRIAVQYDNNVETVTFDCPRYWDKHDMSKMKVYINYIRADHQPDSYPVDTGVTVDENDPSIMHFDWTISSNVTEVHGKIVFLVCIKSVDENGDEHEHWNSELCTDMYVSEGLETQQRVAEKYPDLITHLLTRMDVVENKTTLESMLGYLDTYFSTDAEINKVLKDYVDLYLRTDDSVTKKIADTVNAYIEEHLSATDKTLTVSEMPADAAATGEAIKNTINITSDANIRDSVDGVLKIKKLYGRSEQFSTTGAQLLDESMFVYVANGAIRKIILNLNANTTYIISSDIPRTYGGNTAYVFLMNSAQEPSTSVNGVWGGQNRSVTTLEDGILVIGYRVDDNYVADLTLYHTMLNKGTTALPWEPYTGGMAAPNPEYPQEIKSVVVNEVKACGKNLCKTSNLSTGGTGHVNVSSGSFGEVKANKTYTLSFYNDTSLSLYTMLRLKVGDSLIEFASLNLIANSINKITFTPTDDSGVYANASLGSEYANKEVFKNIQLEEGTEATSYEPYTESTVTLSQPVTLHSIGDVMDELTPDGVVRKFIKLKVSADLSWEYKKTQTYGNHNFQLRLERNGFPKGSISHKAHIAAVKFTHFMYMDDLWDTEGLKRAKAYVYSDEITFSFPPDSEMNSLELWKKFLTDNEVYAYYVMTTPYTEPLPEADAKALKTALRSYNTATYVTTDSPVEPGFELEYPRTLAASYILENQKNVAELMSPIREVSGVGDITIDDSVAGGLRVTKMVGKSVQESYSGAQLFDAKSVDKNSNDTYEIEDGGRVIKTSGGTTTAYAYAKYTLDPTGLLGKTLYLSAKNIENTVSNAYVQLNIVAESGNLYPNITAAKLKQVFTIPEDTTAVAIALYTNNTGSGLSAANEVTITELMLSEVENAPYEPYVGGIPSPNPEYPQPIVSVGEKMAEGKNLLNLPDGEVTISGTLKSVTKNGVVHVSGTPTADTLFAIKGGYNSTTALFTLPIGTYTAHGGVYFHSYDGTNRKVLSSTFTVTEETPVTCVFVKHSENTFRAGTSYDLTIYPMLNEGSIPLPWEPYTGGKKAAFDVGIGNDICGKNLFDCSGLGVKTNNGATFTPVYNEHGKLLYVEVSGNTSDKFADYYLKTGTAWELQSGKYIFSGCPVGGGSGSSNAYSMIVYHKGKPYFDVGSGTAELDIENGDDWYVLIRVSASTSIATNLRFYPMIRLASVEDDTYVPYVEPQNHTLNRKLKAIPVTEASLANYTDESGQMWCADTIEEIDGKMCLVERVGVKEFTSVRAVTNNTTGAVKYIVFFGTIADMTVGTWQDGLSNMFINKKDRLDNSIRFGSNDSDLYVFTDDEKFATKESADAFLASNPITVVYPLATPIITELTNDEIVALRSLKTYHGITHIFTDNNPTGELTVSYGATELGGLTLENKNLHEVNEAIVEENKELITAINSALPFEIIIDDAAGTINFVDRQVGD